MKVCEICIDSDCRFIFSWLMFSGGSSSNNTMAVHHDHDHGDEATVWTCSMHPQIRMDEPGLCPLCAMDLIHSSI